MSHTPKRHAAGFTLIELMISVTIMTLAIVAAMQIVLVATRLAATQELTGQSNTSARSAADEIISNINLAGLGASSGVWVNVGGTATRINPIFGLDGTTGQGGTPAVSNGTGIDDLWLVVGGRNTFRQACSDSGAGSVVTNAGTGSLKVLCTSTLAGSTKLLVSNMNSAALLSTAVYPDGTTVNYAESAVPNFSDSPEKGGFQVGDVVYPARILHYYIAVDPVTNLPGLYRAEGQLTADALGRPFSNLSTTLVQPGIEDLQVSFGFDTALTGNPDSYTFQNGLGATYATGLRSIRLSLVALSLRGIRDANGAPRTGAPFVPVTLENHTPGAVPLDGLRRSQLIRRVELVNMGVASL
jgi:prepilin-type N-terminal cleavage/methylation domain-containing protein